MACVEMKIKGCLSSSYPEMLQKEYWILHPKQIKVGTVVRYRNGRVKCVVKEIKKNVYVISDMSTTRGDTRYVSHKEMMSDFVIVKFLDTNNLSQSLILDITELLPTNSQSKQCYKGFDEKYILHKETGEIFKYACRRINDELIEYTDESYIIGANGRLKKIKNSDIIENYFRTDVTFKDVENL